MVARRFVVRQPPADEEHAVEYDTEDGLDVLRFQIFSLTSVPPDLQKIVVEVDGSVVDDGTDLESIPEGLRLVSIDDGEDADTAGRAQEKSDEELPSMIQIEVEVDGSVVDNGIDIESISEDLRLVPLGEGEDVDAAAAAAAAAAARAQEKSDEELARMFQAEEEALLLQQYRIQSDGGDAFRERVEPYMRQVLKYEDPMRQEAALKTVPVDELKEKALISLAKEATLKAELRNMTYLKNVILKLLETGEVGALLPVVAMLLQFSPDELDKCQHGVLSNVASSPATTLSDGGSTPNSFFGRFTF